MINRDLKINIRSMSLNSSGGNALGLINIEVTGTQLVDAVVYSLMRIKGVQKVFRVNKTAEMPASTHISLSELQALIKRGSTTPIRCRTG